MPTMTRRLPQWLVGSGVIAVSMAVTNVTMYGFTILAARILGPSHYGALAAMMGLLLVLNVLSLGLQATAARRVSATPEHTAQIEQRILAVSYRSALGLGLICLLATPLISVALHLDLPTAALVSVTVVPLTVMGGQAGVLQGERRWLPLALIYLGSGVGRIVFGVLGLLWRHDSLGAMLGVAVGAFVPTVIGWLALRRPRERLTAQHGSDPAAGLLREIGHNSHALLAFFALSNVDVLVARSVLGGHQAGLYAGGLILAKAVLFLPQFVVVVAFPSMASSIDKRMHLRSLGMVLGIGLVTVAGAAVLSGLAVIFIGGPEYSPIQHTVWAFAGLGTLMAMLQLMIYNVVARQDQRSVFVVWAGLVVLLCLAPLTASVTGLLTVVAAVYAAALAVLVVRSLV